MKILANVVICFTVGCLVLSSFATSQEMEIPGWILPVAKAGLQYAYYKYVDNSSKPLTTAVFDQFLRQYQKDQEAIGRNLTEIKLDIERTTENLEHFIDSRISEVILELKFNEFINFNTEIKTDFGTFQTIYETYHNSPDEFLNRTNDFLKSYELKNTELKMVNYLKEGSIGSRSLIDTFVTKLQKNVVDNTYSKQSSINKLLYDFYTSIAYTVYRGNMFLLSCYLLRDDITGRNITTPDDRRHPYVRANSTAIILNEIFANVSQQIIDADSLGIFGDFSLDANVGNIIHLKTAEKYIVGRHETDVVTHVPSGISCDARRSDYMETFCTGTVYDKTIQTRKHVAVVGGGGETVDCTCHCAVSDEHPFTEKYFYKGAVKVEKNGFVITGIRFRQQGKVIYPQIRIGKMTENGIIEANSSYWQSPPVDIDSYNGLFSNLLPLGEVFFGGTADGSVSVLTGIQIESNHRSNALIIFGRKLSNGVLLSRAEVSKRINLVGTEVPSLGKSDSLDPNNRDAANIKVHRNNFHANFSHLFNEMSQTYKQLNLPMKINGEDVITVPEQALTGFGLMHFTNKDEYAGHIKPYLITLDYFQLQRDIRSPTPDFTCFSSSHQQKPSNSSNEMPTLDSKRKEQICKFVHQYVENTNRSDVDLNCLYEKMKLADIRTSPVCLENPTGDDSIFSDNNKNILKLVQLSESLCSANFTNNTMMEFDEEKKARKDSNLDSLDDCLKAELLQFLIESKITSDTTQFLHRFDCNSMAHDLSECDGEIILKVFEWIQDYNTRRDRKLYFDEVEQFPQSCFHNRIDLLESAYITVLKFSILANSAVSESVENFERTAYLDVSRKQMEIGLDCWHKIVAEQ